MESMIGIVVTVVVLITVGGSLFLVFKVLSGIHAKQAQTQKLLANGIPGTARVLGLGATGTSMAIMGQRSVEIALTLEVSIPGRPPYQTQVTQFIPDIRLASVQPGAQVHVRVDPANPNVLAVADTVQGGGFVGGPQAPVISSGGGGGWGAAPGAGNAPVIQPTAGVPGGWGAPPGQVSGPMPGQMGAAGAMGGAPMMVGAGMAAPDMGKAMKRSMTMTIVILLITTVPIAIIMAAVFVDWSAFGIDIGGDGDAPKGGYCEGTVRCCKVVFGNATSANCDSWKSLPAAGCKSTWESYSQTAKSQGKTCK